MLSLQKIDSFLSFQSPIIRSKIHKCRELFLRRGEGNSLKWTYFEGATCKMNRNKQGKGRSQKLEVLRELTFWMTL